jgi:organic hydroperoxide reductase OsmC/OhrA
MADKAHHYEVQLAWTGDRGSGTSGYAAYDRAHVLSAPGKPDIPGSSDPHFRGDPARWNPEELLLASLSACHQLWYLHLCAVNKVTVVGYRDRAAGEMAEHADGSGEFTRVVLRPEVTVTSGSHAAKALELHHQAARLCFVARSMNFPVEHEPSVTVAG